MKIPCLNIHQIVLAITLIWNSYALSTQQAKVNTNNISSANNVLKEPSAGNYYTQGDTSNIGISRSSSTNSFNSETPSNDLSSGSNSNSYLYHYDYYPSYYHPRNKRCPYGVNDPRCIPRTDNFGSFGMGGSGSEYGTMEATEDTYGVPSYGTSYGATGMTGDFDDGIEGGGKGGGKAGAGGLGGLGGLAGLAGLAGLKGLLPVALPLLLLLLLGPILFLPLLLLLPIPVITVPVTRALKPSYGLQANYLSLVPMVAKALTGEECIERISCEIASRGNGYKFFDWIKKWAEESSMKENKWFQKFYRGIQMPSSNNNEDDNACQKLKCNPTHTSNV